MTYPMPHDPAFIRPFDEVVIAAKDLFSLAGNSAGVNSAYVVPLNNYDDYRAITISPSSDIRDVALFLDNEWQPYPLIASGARRIRS